MSPSFAHPRSRCQHPSLGWFALALLVTVGCDQGPQLFEVRGTVQFRGQPVTYGVINFFPSDGGRALGGPLQSDGGYRFELPEGEYGVIINAPSPLPPGWKEGDPVPTGKPLVPPKYSRVRTSGLTATVSPGDDSIQINYDLQ